jgi:serine/threonine-protein kinase
MVVGPAELKTLSRLLDEALALHPSERASWLSSLDGRDARHRATLVQLLAEADNPDDRFLTRPSLDELRGVGQDNASEHPGMRVGPYLLEWQIGSGGMGSVWLARRVASLETKVDQSDSSRLLDREKLKPRIGSKS